MARLALFICIFVIPLWASFDNDAFLFGFNQLIWANTVDTVRVSRTIAVIAFRVALVAFLDARCLIKPPIETFRAKLQIDFSHLNEL